MAKQSAYYRTYNESHEGETGYFYCEVIDQVITRMINAFGEKLFWATPDNCKDECYDFTDQPELDDADIERMRMEYELIELSKVDFETLWALALKTP